VVALVHETQDWSHCWQVPSVCRKKSSAQAVQAVALQLSQLLAHCMQELEELFRKKPVLHWEHTLLLSQVWQLPRQVWHWLVVELTKKPCWQVVQVWLSAHTVQLFSHAEHALVLPR
jgi:hypothetical protein